MSYVQWLFRSVCKMHSEYLGYHDFGWFNISCTSTSSSVKSKVHHPPRPQLPLLWAAHLITCFALRIFWTIIERRHCYHWMYTKKTHRPRINGVLLNPHWLMLYLRSIRFTKLIIFNNNTKAYISVSIELSTKTMEIIWARKITIVRVEQRPRQYKCFVMTTFIESTTIYLTIHANIYMLKDEFESLYGIL